MVTLASAVHIDSASIKKYSIFHFFVQIGNHLLPVLFLNITPILSPTNCENKKHSLSSYELAHYFSASCSKFISCLTSAESTLGGPEQFLRFWSKFVYADVHCVSKTDIVLCSSEGRNLRHFIKIHFQFRSLMPALRHFLYSSRFHFPVSSSAILVGLKIFPIEYF